MTAISTNFTVNSYAFGSLLTSTKMTNMMDNDVFLKEWMGQSFVNSAIQDHNHDGANSALVNNIGNGIVTQAKMADNAIGRAELKDATGSVSTNTTLALGGANLTLAGGEYGFYPQIKRTGSATDMDVKIADTYPATTSYVTNIWLAPHIGQFVNAQQRYFQASPPYKIGDINWGHFLFVLQDINTNKIIASYEAEDPPWAYNGKTWLDKNNTERIEVVPHPFADYTNKDPSIDGYEIVLIDLGNVKTNDWINSQKGQGKSILDDLDKLNLGTKKNADTELGIDVQGFSDKIKIRNATHSDY